MKRTLVHQKWRPRPGRAATRSSSAAGARTRTGAFTAADEDALRRRRSRPPAASGSGTSDGPRASRAEEQAFAAEIRAWLATNLELPPGVRRRSTSRSRGARRWQAKLAADRWVGIHWPAEYGGRGATPVEVAIYNMEYARSRALQPVNRVGINLAGPTLLAHGTDEQKQRWLPRILDASEIWCQLFSEPEAGSDLASLTTQAVPGRRRVAARGPEGLDQLRAVRPVGDRARAHRSGRAEAPRASRTWSSTWRPPGIEIRPLVQITGEAEFNEVFFDGVFVPEDHLVGGLHQGWAVANTTLAHERGTAFPFKEQVVHEVYLDELYALARRARRARRRRGRPTRSRSRSSSCASSGCTTGGRCRASAGASSPGPESSVTKLAWTDMTQHLSDAALCGRGRRRRRSTGPWSRQWLWSKAASIAGGTSEVQRTIIGDRILGLPR